MRKEIRVILLVFSLILVHACNEQPKQPVPVKIINDTILKNADQSVNHKKEFSCKINKICLLKNYAHKLDSFPHFIYMDVEMFGQDLAIDLDDLEATIIKTDGKEERSWAYESIFLDKYGRKTKSGPLNNNSTYLHIGVILPVTQKPKKAGLYYWEGLLCNSLSDLQDITCEIQE